MVFGPRYIHFKFILSCLPLPPKISGGSVGLGVGLVKPSASPTKIIGIDGFIIRLWKPYPTP